MAKRDWTPQQLDSITATGGTVLVSAAAGSGKTAVLVERVLRRITDSVNPVDVDRLLVVTFTKAAAAEMRQRLSAALSDYIAQEPGNPLYQRQQLLLPQASISTVDGFCAALLREQAGRQGIPAGFCVGEEAEIRLLSADALDAVLEESYRQRDPAFLALSRQLNSLRSDENLRQAVLRLYTFMQAHPFPEQWLAEQLEAYTAVRPLETTRWMAPIVQELSHILQSAVMLACRAAAISQRDGLEPYAEPTMLDVCRLEQMQAQIPTASYDALQAAFGDFKLTGLKAIRAKDAAVAEDKQRVQALRELIKKKLARAGKWFALTEEEHRQELAMLAPPVEALAALVQRYAAVFTKLKREKKLLDYSDLEHECLRLLLDEHTHQPTPLAREISRRYTEILVDEYQDTNGAQDALFRSITPAGDALFMVGDVKQSIYGFRQAMPHIFTGRRDSYAPYHRDAPAFPATITLENNFRSRREVTEGVNFLFRQLMHRDLGGVDYDGREALVPSAVYPEAVGREPEWQLLDGSAGGSDEDSVTAEATAIGRRIQELMATMTVGQGEAVRPLQYGDIGILLRTKKHMTVLADTLQHMGIPVSAAAQENFFTAAEVMTALSLLRVIDNPLREVELTGLLLSPLGGFTADDCARLRVDSTDRRLPLYTAVEQASQGTDELAAKCTAMLSLLRRARFLAVSLPADRLLERLYRETGLIAVFAARSGGRRRVANLHRLDQLARSFEQGEFRGLSAFVRYMDRLEKQGGGFTAAGAPSAEAVRMMSIHNSKGLEFPVVFLARLGDKFNDTDAAAQLLFHQTAGIGLRLRDEEAGEKFRTLPFDGVLSAVRQDGRAEELRVLYVAMTRAREKLILVISSPDLKKQLAGLEQQLSTETEIPADALIQARSPADWLLMAALRHPSFAHLRQYPAETALLPAALPFAVVIQAPASPETVKEAPPAVPPMADEALAARLRQRLAYVYPYAALTAVPAKLAASQLSHQAMARQYIATARPAFLQQEGLTAGQKGTALHTFMQFADYARGAADTAAEAARLVAAGFLTPKQAEVLPPDKLAKFFASSLYARMAASPDCRREYHFTVAVPAVMAAPNMTDTAVCDGETVVVQGIADCIFREGDRLILVDYKTDRVKTPQELIERYRSQLLFYRQALEPIFGLPVTEAILYSFHLEQAITVNWDE